jgi:hypothetical protein
MAIAIVGDGLFHWLSQMRLLDAHRASYLCISVDAANFLLSIL